MAEIKDVLNTIPPCCARCHWNQWEFCCLCRHPSQAVKDGDLLRFKKDTETEWYNVCENFKEGQPSFDTYPEGSLY